MRLSELLERPVMDVAGNRIGGIADVVLVQDGPVVGANGAAGFRVAGLIVVENAHSELLGYERDVGPLLFRLFVHHRAREVYNVSWDHVVEVSDELVHLNVTREALDRHERSLRA